MKDETTEATEATQITEEAWSQGFGGVRHTPLTRRRVKELIERLGKEQVCGDAGEALGVLWAADRIASAGMWLVVHETYARNVYLDGRPLAADDFKPDPQGHTGGSLNMVPAYAGYMAANTLAGTTRAWLMGQGHCVAAIDSVNLLLDNLSREHAARYSVSDSGLTRYVRDFYSYALNDEGKQDSPLGSHVNAHTAGGLSEGGYLGFAELQYVHMPLPGESLVVFLSDGAFEEQRGSDWAPRWWRAEDSGIVTPIMISNGRRIDQRTTMSQSGGVSWLVRHLRLNGFDPIVFDGRDPCAFVWAIFEMERRLRQAAAAAQANGGRYPVRLPYGIAVATKGHGFFGAGTNLAHNLPLPGNPARDRESARIFNRSARRLLVPGGELESARSVLRRDGAANPFERDNPLATRDVRLTSVPELKFLPVSSTLSDPSAWVRESPMAAIDLGFLSVVEANPHLRPRVGNPDEMKSNRMTRTLEALKFRVTDPEPGVPESITGAIITALNEEAVSAAALANKGGINITVTYEAFAPKMLGLIRQEVIFSDQCAHAGRPQRWLSIPLILTSHLWENGKNEQSHQDPTMAEALMGEAKDVSRVLFPADYNTALAAITRVYQTQGQLWTLVVSKDGLIPSVFAPDEAEELLRAGGLRVKGAGYQPDDPRVILAAIGSYQLVEVLKASRRLEEKKIPHSVVYLIEPARFAAPRDAEEGAHAAPREVIDALFPGAAARVFVTHTRPAPILGLLQPLQNGRPTAGLGFINNGGTLDANGLLFVNESSWAHCVAAAARVTGTPRENLLTGPEQEALDRWRSPKGVIF
ncbi:MAG TPA: xylulose 5-phosphate 3-epimerase [Planctomycetota bacterium]|nr:xylulose 5-phosphate 3-epimerase [Planctomycetota bacterium]